MRKNMKNLTKKAINTVVGGFGAPGNPDAYNRVHEYMNNERRKSFVNGFFVGGIGMSLLYLAPEIIDYAKDKLLVAKNALFNKNTPLLP